MDTGQTTFWAESRHSRSITAQPDAQLYTWTDDAISQDFRGQLEGEFTVLTFVDDDLLTGFPAGAKFESSGFSINCPIVQRLE